MTALHHSSILHNEQPVWNDFRVSICSLTYSSTTDCDGSSESDGELLLGLFQQPELGDPRIKVRSERGSRPFPYTRSKTRWRKRPQDEIKYLRAHTAELENLKNALSNPDTKPNLLEEIGRDHTVPRDDCCNQKLNAALVENRKLRAMVAGRYQVAKALQDAIDGHARMKAREVYCPTSAAAPNELIFALLDEATELYC